MPYRGFGHVGTASHCYSQLARVFLRAGNVRDVVESALLNTERCVTEIASLLLGAVQTTGKMFEKEHMRMINMVTSVHPGGVGGSNRVPK